MRRTLLILSVVIAFRLPRHARRRSISRHQCATRVGRWDDLFEPHRGTHPQRRHPDRWRQDRCRWAPLVRADAARDQRHRLHGIDDYGRLLEQPCPLPRKKVDRCRNAPCVRAQPAASNDDHAVWVYERVRYMVDVGEHASAARSHRGWRSCRSEDPIHRSRRRSRWVSRAQPRLRRWPHTGEPGAPWVSCLSRESRLPRVAEAAEAVASREEAA